MQKVSRMLVCWTAFAATAMATAAASPHADTLAAVWDFECAHLGPQAHAPHAICVPSEAALEGFESYSTFMVQPPNGTETRHQFLSGPGRARENRKWRVLVPVPDDTICLRQRGRTSEHIACGSLDVLVSDADCDEAVRHATATCRLRPVPFDNPTFPAFPDPLKPGYFAPWPAYEKAGGMPGDIDEEFFCGIGIAQGRTSCTQLPLTRAQRRVLDILAWQEFLAVNWPSSRERAETRFDVTTVAGKDPRNLCPAWAGWRRVAEVMRANDRLPIPWGLHPIGSAESESEPNGVCRANFPNEHIAQLGATGGPLGDPIGNLEGMAKQATGHVLWDANGLFVLYDTRVNQVLYDDILKGWIFKREKPEMDLRLSHGFYHHSGFKGLHKAPPTSTGAIAVKFAWKQLTGCDRHEDYLLAWADPLRLDEDLARRVIEDTEKSACPAADTPNRMRAVASSLPSAGPASADAGSEAFQGKLRFLQRRGLLIPEESAPVASPTIAGPVRPQSVTASTTATEGGCDTRPHHKEGQGYLLGLVGMHIAHKTTKNPQWNWATFVHRKALEGDSPLFLTEGCGPGNGSAGAGSPPMNCTNCGPVPSADNEIICRTRICSPVQTPEDTEDLNTQVQGLLEQSGAPPIFRRLANYRLLGAQWVGSPQNGNDKNSDRFVRDPERLLNPLLETFVTDPDLDDCHSCHQHAGWRDGEKTVGSDLMFFLAPPH